jgi:FkbM family methyltransferase
MTQFYSQHGEDQRLRDLIGNKSSVFYIDVGAWEPELDSVTKHFYDSGGHGINIEPVPEYHRRLVDARPRDINLCLALGSKKELRTITWVVDSPLTTFVPEFAARYSSEKKPILVEVATLSDICANYIQSDQVIDFLKIDVEGHEREVLLGADFQLWRPTFLCIEATVPETDIPAWESWDQYVTEQGYLFLDFDGLNRYYRRAL